MLKRCLKSLLTIVVVCTCLVSCSEYMKLNKGGQENIDKGSELNKDALDKAKEMITGDNTSDKVLEKYKDIKKVSEFNLSDLMTAIEDTGNKVTVIAKEKDFFDAPKFQLIVGESTIDAYDYEELITLRKDISAISDGGYIISGSEIKWKSTPHYFLKGEVLAIYDGDSKEILTMLNEILSDELF